MVASQDPGASGSWGSLLQAWCLPPRTLVLTLVQGRQDSSTCVHPATRTAHSQALPARISVHVHVAEVPLGHMLDRMRELRHTQALCT